MFRKEREKKEKIKREASIVTKESICATCALFSFLALLILCTRSVIFGGFGLAIHVLLTGIFGYFAYPLVIGALYLSVTGLLGARLVKNRKLGACIVAAVSVIGLIVHTATTYSWSLEGYLSRCFEAGENFPKATPTGFFGGLIVFALSSILTQIGTLVLFSSLAVFSIYLCYLASKKGSANAEKKPATEEAQKQEPIDAIAYADATTPLADTSVRSEARAPQMAAMPVQRPGVSLDDGVGQAPQAGLDSQIPMNSREFLFGGSPAEDFKRNLLFDPNSRANRRPNVDPVQPSLQSSYTPSYTEEYTNSLNAADSAPTKVVEDRVSYADEPPVEETPNYVAPIEEEPVYPTPVLSDTPQEPTVSFAEENGGDFSREEVLPDTRVAPSEEEEGSYRRHDFMGLFSAENPNVFGNDEETARFGRDFADRAMERAQDSLEERDSRGDRDGLRLFDDDIDGPYTLRADFDTPRDNDRMEDLNRNDGLDSGRRGYEEEAPRGRGFEEESPVVTPQPPKAVEPPKPEPPKPRVIRPYVRPRLDDFDCRDIEPTANDEEVRMTKESIIATLEEFKITGASIASVTFGPTVTRYNVTIPRSISPKKVVALDQSIAIDLHSSGVNIYPNYEDGVVSIEVPNKDRQFVQLGCMLSGDTFVNAKPSSIMFAMGKDVANRKIYGDISKMIHLLVAGSSGSGKSVFLGSLIISLIYKYSPEELRLILIDPKKTEFVLYNNLPHLMINEIITDAGKAVQSLNWAIGEMNRRYTLFEQMSYAGKYVVNLDQYNEQMEKADRLPKIVIIIDELADLMLAAKKEMEDRIQNLTQKARAAGIHLIVATQRPSTDVITGVIKSNLATRVGFYVATDVDSRVILDQSGAQKLLGKGDFLYTMPGINIPVRVQSAFTSPEESQKIVNFIKNNNEAYYDEEATAYINSRGGNGGSPESNGGGDGNVDPMYIDALRYVIQSNSASISMIQRKCSTGYNKAGKIVEWMEDMGYISPFDGAKARKVLITQEEFENKYGPLE